MSQEDDNESLSSVSTRTTLTTRRTRDLLQKMMDKIESLERKISYNEENLNINNYRSISSQPYLSWSYISDLFWETNKLDETKRNENGDFIISAFDLKELIFSICYIVFILTCFIISYLRRNKFNNISKLTNLTNTPIDFI